VQVLAHELRHVEQYCATTALFDGRKVEIRCPTSGYLGTRLASFKENLKYYCKTVLHTHCEVDAERVSHKLMYGWRSVVGPFPFSRFVRVA